MGRNSRDRNATADTPDDRIDILFVLFNFAGGGLEKKVLRLAAMLKDRGNTVAIAVCYPEGALADRVAGGIEVIPLEKGPVWKARAAAVRADPGAVGALLRPFLLPRKSPRMLPFLPSLARLLARRNPRSMFTAMPHMNVTAVLARRLAGADTRVVLSEINAVRDKLGSSPRVDVAIRIAADEARVRTRRRDHRGIGRGGRRSRGALPDWPATGSPPCTIRP